MVSTRFCVIYQFRIHAGQDSEFCDAWASLTEAIRDTRGGLGSRLHRTDDGWWLAYAQWPDRQTWERAQTNPEPAHAHASARMAAIILERREPILLTPHCDLMVSCHAAD